jgi:hypothetical protein
MRSQSGHLEWTSAREWVAVTVACVAVFLASWTLLHHVWYRSGGELIDTPLYQSTARLVVDRKVPYRDFSLEYPPGFLLAALAPAATADPNDFSSYARSFDRWMAGAGVAVILLAAGALAALRAPPARFAAALGLMAVSPLLLGNVMLSRYDLWVAALAIGGLTAMLAGRDRLGGLLIAAAIATKLWPAVLVPLGLAWVWRRRGRGAAVRWLGVVTAVCAAFFLPFALLAPGGLGHSFGVQLGRPLQIESLGSAVLLAAHNLGGLPVSALGNDTSMNLVAGGATAAAAVTTVMQALALCAVWIAFARGPADSERFVAAAGASVAVFVAFGKVFSPQYLIWLIPFVPLVRSRLAALLLAVALVATGFYFPAHYSALVELQAWAAWLLLARNLAVLLLAAELSRLLLQATPTTATDALEAPHGKRPPRDARPLGQNA